MELWVARFRIRIHLTRGRKKFNSLETQKLQRQGDKHFLKQNQAKFRKLLDNYWNKNRTIIDMSTFRQKLNHHYKVICRIKVRDYFRLWLKKNPALWISMKICQYKNKKILYRSCRVQQIYLLDYTQVLMTRSIVSIILMKVLTWPLTSILATLRLSTWWKIFLTRTMYRITRKISLMHKLTKWQRMHCSMDWSLSH